MIRIEDTEVMGMRKAIKDMRNAMNSWDKSDSIWCGNCSNTENEGLCIDINTGSICNGFIIGKEDMKLAKRLIKAGSSDRKFMRMIHVQADVTAPLYVWKQIDQYRVGVTTNSTSTMHTIHKKKLTLDDFSHEHLQAPMLEILKHTIHGLNDARDAYLSSKDELMWWQMIQLLPSSFNQMRTIDLDYETLFSIYHQRKNHKLDEWKEFCEWIKTLPFMKEFLEE